MSAGSIKIYVGVTDLDWFEYLSARNPDEVNFWQPGGRSQFRAVQPGERTLPVLDAAHIKAYGAGGDHEVSNGILLRSDIHKLFDCGYVTVDADHRFVVSPRLREDFQNGRHYYALAGQELALPKRSDHLPDVEALRWHREERFLA